jgi:uncharacterized protein YndB with AHSA1/START domain
VPLHKKDKPLFEPKPAASAKDEITVTDREIISERVFDAPRELVFRAWTEPDHLARWFGPKGFTNTFQVFEPRPGGQWKFLMHSPNGVDYPNESVFEEVVRPSRIVFRHLGPPNFRATVELIAEGKKTRMIWRMTFETPAEFDKVKSFAPEGNRQNLPKLEAELARMRET